MKKITLISIVLFGLILGSIFTLSYLYPPVISTHTIGNTIANTTVTTSGTGLIAESTALTTSEVGKHNKSSDCYLIIKNKVYDVSTYIGYHPGGSNTIVSRCGQEVSGIFASIHSNFAWDLLGKYYIGDLSTSTSPTTLSDSTTILNSLKQKLLDQYQGAEVVNVKPKSDFYVSKMIYNGKLYEIHLDSDGNILQSEVEDDESDWGEWDTDTDDTN